MKSFSILLLLLTFCGTVFAQTSNRFTITRNVVANGGTTFSSSSSRFQLGSTIAQPLTSVTSSNRFSIHGGFWISSPLNIASSVKVGNNFTFSFQSELGKTYAAQYIDSLSTMNWQSLPLLIGDGTLKTVTNSAPKVSRRFYRLIEQ